MLQKLIGVLAVVLWGCFSWAQVPEITLRSVRTVEVEESTNAGPLVVRVPVKCDSSGNLYFRRYWGPDYDAAPIEKVTADGKVAASSSLQSSPGFESAPVYDFTVGLRGDVYVLTTKERGKHGIARFRSNGRLDTYFELKDSGISGNGEFDPYQMAMFSSGEFLVAGRIYSKDEQGEKSTPRLVLFDPSGRFVRDVRLGLAATLSPPRGDDGAAPDISAETAPLSGAVAAEDGNIYLMRPEKMPVILVVSPSGEPVRRLVVSPPQETFRPLDLKVAGGRMAIQFVESSKDKDPPLDRNVITLFDAGTGEPIISYSPPSGIWGCYDLSGLRFLSHNPRRQGLAIQLVVP